MDRRAVMEFSRRMLHAWRPPSVSPERLRALGHRLGEELLLVDLRPAQRFAAGQIPGARSRPSRASPA